MEGFPPSTHLGYAITEQGLASEGPQGLATEELEGPAPLALKGSPGIRIRSRQVLPLRG